MTDDRSTPPVRRPHDRAQDALRPLTLNTGALKFADGSAHIDLGDTRVLAAASLESRVPPFLEDRGEGWVTAEYAMLPRATQRRSAREVSRGRPSGRTAEIQRLIGRSLRAAVDRGRMPGFTATLDCDVLQADGGTRTASITAAYVALVEALGQAYLAGDLSDWPVVRQIAAVSVGIVDGTPRLDLEYEEDAAADVDLNVVGTADGEIIEVQGTGEQRSFTRAELDALLDLAFGGIAQLVAAQNTALAAILADVEALRTRGRQRTAPKSEASIWGGGGAKSRKRP
ncbi:MAG: ribonuclease PH [Acidobacteriota bacterium]